MKCVEELFDVFFYVSPDTRDLFHSYASLSLLELQKNAYFYDELAHAKFGKAIKLVLKKVKKW